MKRARNNESRIMSKSINLERVRNRHQRNTSSVTGNLSNIFMQPGDSKINTKSIFNLDASMNKSFVPKEDRDGVLQYRQPKYTD